MADLDYLVHGAGGVGCVVAARLADIGRNVQLIARGPHLEALRRDGLRVTGTTESQHRLAAFGAPSEARVGESTAVILAMKTGDTEAALDAAGNVYDGRPMVCFQNGVANERYTVARSLPTYGCVVRIGGRILEPGVVAHTGGLILDLGRWPSGVDDTCTQIVGDFTEAGFRSRAVENIEAAKWGKLVRNLNNAYLALCDVSVQEANRFEVHRLFMADIEEEAANVLEAAGIEYEPSGKRSNREAIERLRQPGEWTHVEVPTDHDQLALPSTWQDLHFRRGSVEVEHFNGEIVALGEELGIPTPLNRIVMERCVSAARDLVPPGSETAESLRSAAAAEGDVSR